MPRESLRTVAPAKVLACQSAENACTRAKASLVISSIARPESGMSMKKLALRIMAKPK